MRMCARVLCSKDDPRPDLQRAQDNDGDEPEAVRRVQRALPRRRGRTRPGRLGGRRAPPLGAGLVAYRLARQVQPARAYFAHLPILYYSVVFTYVRILLY